MILNQTLAVLGGDTRQLSLAERLCEKKIGVRVFGLPCERMGADIARFEDWREAIDGAAAVILPLPASPDGRCLHMPLVSDREAPLLADIFDAAQSLSIAGGKFSPGVKALAEKKGVILFDFFENEEFQQKNALPTAEGAVSILMRELPRTVSGLSVAVTGFGRVSKALVRLLLGMGARVTVGARKEQDLIAARALGCKTVRLTGTDAVVRLSLGQAAILNTVPHWLFTDEVFAEMREKPLMIDLASAPGGIDAGAAAARGIHVIWALSLPGKYAPETAGEIIADTVLSHLREEGIL